MNFKEKILKLKKEKNALILAHYYQIGEIQDIADYVGDSLGLSQKAAEANVDIILFAGVHFMAETAKILNPNTKVLLPDLDAGCSLADTCPYDDFVAFKNKYPDHIVISYINTSAAIKTVSDVICTSGNAVKLVNSFSKDQKIIFAPDRNLGGYVNQMTGRNMILWEGTCEVHNILTTEAILKLKEEHPKAKIVAHPECQAQILQIADYVGSTTGLLKFTKTNDAKEFIVATETGILHQMHLDSPDKKFYVVPSDKTCACNDCPYMKLNTMEKVYFALKNETPSISLDAETIEKALIPIERMLKISKELKII